MLYEIAITKTPTVIETQAGAQEKLVLPFTAVTATNPNSALIVAAVQNAEALAEAVKNSPDNLVVKMRQS